MPDAPTSPPLPVSDLGLRCPKCDYNLTGLSEQRCPECGWHFNLDEIRKRFSGIPAPVPGWDDGKSNIVARFARTCYETWFRPGRFGKQFPPCYRLRSARMFRWTVNVLCVGLCYFIASEPLDFALVFAVWLGVAACEVALAVVFTITFRRAGECRRPRAGGSSSWLGLIGYFRSFTLLSLMATAILLHYPPSAWAGLVAIVAWWWIALGLAATADVPKDAVTAVGIALIPVAVAFGSIVGLLFSAILAVCALS